MVPSLPAESADRLREVVDELDNVIADIRTTIFDLQAQETAVRGVRSTVLKLTGDAAERLGYKPRVQFVGAVDTIADRDAADQLLAVLREALSNVIRHAGAGAIEVTVAARDGELVLTVADDGVGPVPETTPVTGFGMRNMESRAAALGGHLPVPGQRAPRHRRRVAGAARPSLSEPPPGARFVRPFARTIRDAARAITPLNPRSHATRTAIATGMRRILTPPTAHWRAVEADVRKCSPEGGDRT